MELKVYNINGSETGRTITLDDSIFAIEPNDHAIYLDCKQYLADQRQGTHKSKERSEIAHSTRKLKRQKGTGGARSGDIKSPVFVGGGRIFGPKPRDYRFKLNVKVKRLARRSALSYKAADSALTVVENFSFEAPKTKSMIEVLKKLNVNDKKSLFVIENQNNFVSLSARNLKNVKVVNVSQLNTYDIVNAANVVVSEGSISEIVRVLATK
ncbi:MAG: 50S ribosomal protein L4 [Bacteroidales bacterium]|jgi:large subunit ribosomal protein L4|nr:50S ribosomal protein L4 [Bacteroidales bacterium]MBR4715924.1 50S ribosomal protein L4 [Bacteroidales bacterium]MCR4930980.1 50S ribosomal protein L4 [Bacteroidales bacterium]